MQMQCRNHNIEVVKLTAIRAMTTPIRIRYSEMEYNVSLPLS